MAEELDMRTTHSIPIDILNDLLTRFIIYVPQSAKENLIRICFQIEMAHWFYLDFYVGKDPRLQKCSIYEFAAHVFQHVPFLKNKSHKLKEILDEWKEYKKNVPTFGAIILSEDMGHVLLVQSYWARSSWGFPKGKINQDENPEHCATREVWEETGFDIEPYIKSNEYLESVINDQLVRLYVIKNVPIATEFKPRTRFEIRSCSWFPISSLPVNKKDTTPKTQIGVPSSSFFMVLPFVRRLKMICYGHGNEVYSKHSKEKSNSTGDSEPPVAASKTIEKKLPENDENGRRLKKKQSRRQAKRQLFSDNSSDYSFQFSAPSWLNFKFDRVAIAECMPNKA